MHALITHRIPKLRVKGVDASKMGVINADHKRVVPTTFGLGTGTCNRGIVKALDSAIVHTRCSGSGSPLGSQNLKKTLIPRLKSG